MFLQDRLAEKSLMLDTAMSDGAWEMENAITTTQQSVMSTADITQTQQDLLATSRRRLQELSSATRRKSQEILSTSMKRLQVAVHKPPDWAAAQPHRVSNLKQVSRRTM